MKQLPPSDRLAALVSNVTQTMLGISFIPAINDRAHPDLCWRTAVMLVHGARPLTVGLSSSHEGCLALTAAMFSCPSSEVDPSMINDALRELVNMTAGLLRTELALDQALAVPQVVSDATVLAKLAELHPGLVLRAKEIGLALWAHEGHPIMKLTAGRLGGRQDDYGRKGSPAMPRILTVDDSRAIRMIVGKQLQPLGFEIGEAEDGNDGLAKMQGSHYNLVILDVTMPNLDGPGMLAKLRESGDKTPVLMLTSEAKTAIVTTLMRLGISDYVLKPFKGEELKLKVLKALKLPADYAPAAAAAAPAAAVAGAETTAPGAAATSAASRALVIDDMENVHKKVQSMIPATVTLDTSLTASEGMALCRANKYALILIDGELPDVNLSSLTKQLRLLQSKVTLVALALRTANNVTGEMRAQGFDEVLLKPFSNEAVEALVEKCFVENLELLTVQENFVRISGFRGREDKLEHYFQKLSVKLKDVLSKLAEACFDSAVLDATELPLAQPLRAGQFMAEVAKASTDAGVSLRVVGSADLATVVSRFEEAKTVKLFQSVEEARAAA